MFSKDQKLIVQFYCLSEEKKTASIYLIDIIHLFYHTNVA